jgi:hypothetical protein
LSRNSRALPDPSQSTASGCARAMGRGNSAGFGAATAAGAVASVELAQQLNVGSDGRRPQRRLAGCPQPTADLEQLAGVRPRGGRGDDAHEPDSGVGDHDKRRVARIAQHRAVQIGDDPGEHECE